MIKNIFSDLITRNYTHTHAHTHTYTHIYIYIYIYIYAYWQIDTTLDIFSYFSLFKEKKNPASKVFESNKAANNLRNGIGIQKAKCKGN